MRTLFVGVLLGAVPAVAVSQVGEAEPATVAAGGPCVGQENVSNHGPPRPRGVIVAGSRVVRRPRTGV